jgi:Fe-S-cluster-containing hydrogenase component 2
MARAAPQPWHWRDVAEVETPKCGDCVKDSPCHKACVVEAMHHVRETQKRANKPTQEQLSERLDDLLYDWEVALD